jgi:hypothetical protein
MNKKGQFYIIIAVLLSFALFSVTYATNTIEEPVLYSNFNEVSENYIYESSNLINYLLKNKDQDIKTEISVFTQNFLSYAKVRDPSFEMIYFYSENNVISIDNTFNGESISFQSDDLLGGSEDIIQDVSLEVGGVDFVYQVPIKASNFGKDWTTTTTAWGGDIKLNLGGIIYPIHLNPSDFNVILRSSDFEYTAQMSN